MEIRHWSLSGASIHPIGGVWGPELDIPAECGGSFECSEPVDGRSVQKFKIAGGP
jgi:hypothetical protein